jgi:hypothetical protein
MITHLLEKQYVDAKGNPTTEWEPCGHSPLHDGKINDSHQKLIDTNPHKDNMGHKLPNGGASFRYNFRHVAYERIELHSGLTKAFHHNLVKAIRAVGLLHRVEDGPGGLNEMYGGFKDDASRKDWLLQQPDGNEYTPDIITVALLLYNGYEAEAYAELWKLVRDNNRLTNFNVEV